MHWSDSPWGLAGQIVAIWISLSVIAAACWSLGVSIYVKRERRKYYLSVLRANEEAREAAAGQPAAPAYDRGGCDRGETRQQVLGESPEG